MRYWDYMDYNMLRVLDMFYTLRNTKNNHNIDVCEAGRQLPEGRLFFVRLIWENAQHISRHRLTYQPDKKYVSIEWPDTLPANFTFLIEFWRYFFIYKYFVAG